MNTDLQQAQRLIRDAQNIIARAQKYLDDDEASDTLDYEMECWHDEANEFLQPTGGKS